MWESVANFYDWYLKYTKGLKPKVRRDFDRILETAYPDQLRHILEGKHEEFW